MFPIYYNGKKYYEEDCDEVFLSFYLEPEAMSPFGVYMSEGVWITPDGKCHHD